MSDLDPIEFGRQIGSLIREAIAPLKARLDALENKHDKGIKFRGKYQTADEYRPGDVVAFDECLWSCTKDADAGDRPGPESPVWALMLRGK